MVGLHQKVQYEPDGIITIRVTIFVFMLSEEIIFLIL
jgi:hypothetical protein